jgi:hypothetical protein
MEVCPPRRPLPQPLAHRVLEVDRTAPSVDGPAPSVDGPPRPVGAELVVGH